MRLKECIQTTTKLSEKGQVVIPKKVRLSYGWTPGVQFSIEESEDGIKLKPIKPFEKSTINDVVGCLNYRGPRKTLKDMVTLNPSDYAAFTGVKIEDWSR
jgi:AbrB family looped-hinge helix DNA binding protein